MKGIYIHIPFCKQKCRYCDFVSYCGREDVIDGYIDALKREAAEYAGEKADTIFIGGGTPSVLSAGQMKKVTDMCFDTFDIAPGYEFTIEANPGTLDDRKIEAMLCGGINRISLGVQSFNDGELRKIGRIHSAETAYNTICLAKKSGFSNINIDLMTALPNQTRESLAKTLETAVLLPVTHISAYSLIIEDGTPLAKEYDEGKLILPPEDVDREMYAYAVDYLGEKGFAQYEISNFAKKDHECRHNIKYWTCEPYIGLGAAAHSFTGDKRYYNTSDLDEYMRGSGREVTHLTENDKISEFIITGLRMNIGISETEFKERFNMDFGELYGKTVDKFISLGLMQYSGGRYSLTRRGIDVSNSILCEFV